MEQLDSRSIEQAKKFLTRSLLGLLSRDQTARTINAILSAQIERLLIAPSAGSATTFHQPRCNAPARL
jgi:hypothetical protein